MQEVRGAARRYDASLRYIRSIGLVVENAAESSALSFDLYRQGLTAFTNVDDAELNYLTYENTLVAARSQALSALVDLYKALGGDGHSGTNYEKSKSGGIGRNRIYGMCLLGQHRRQP